MKKYISPELQVCIFETADVITASVLQFLPQNNTTPQDMNVDYDNTFWK